MRYDTLIAGAGLAGLQCARLLAQRGLRVLLVDRKASLVETIQTTGIFVRKTWEDFPLPDEQLGPAIRDVILYSPARRAMRLTAQHDEFRIGRMSWLYLYLLEQCVRAGVTWLPETTFEAYDGEWATLRRRGHKERVSTRYVIGADGARSRVARALRLDTNREMLIGIEDIVPPTGSTPELHCFLDPRLAPGYIAWLANDGHEAHVGVAGYRDRFDPAVALDAFRASLPFAIGRTIERRGGLIPVGGMLRRIANDRGLVVGDAAGAVSPLTAGGLDAALRLSTFAADVVTNYLEHGDKRVLAQYTGDRFRARFLARRWMRRAIRATAHPLLMEVACALMRTPPLRAMAEHVFFARGSFPDVAVEPISARA
ncbi:MAG TPA: NAD(P)/FAD-dependent oxidoreductase [Thermoanaerobaculia bacterium]|nr:NAD(P)/FAD-dependent oxidoreductase [Thermoanaerobaculia bacterium]